MSVASQDRFYSWLRVRPRAAERCGGSCGHFLLSTFSRLPSMAWRPWPPHPRPLTPDPSPPFHGGEGRNLCFKLQWKLRMAPLAPVPGVRGGICVFKLPSLRNSAEFDFCCVPAVFTVWVLQCRVPGIRLRKHGILSSVIHFCLCRRSAHESHSTRAASSTGFCQHR